jgi:hypothetical protein
MNKKIYTYAEMVKLTKAPKPFARLIIRAMLNDAELEMGVLTNNDVTFETFTGIANDFFKLAEGNNNYVFRG